MLEAVERRLLRPGSGGYEYLVSCHLAPVRHLFFFSSRRRHTRSVSAFLLNRSSDLVLYGNLPPREISMKDVFRSGDSSKKFKIAEGQWYRYAPSYVSPAYHLLEGFPFIQEPPSGDLQERVLIRHHDYDQ